MERISIFNYEAFYLDYLEGNLGEEDTALLMAFLKEHPELRVDEDLPVIAVNVESPGSEFLSSLKQVDYTSDEISVANVEQFMIAETEDLLSPERVEELNRFTVTSDELTQLRRIYGKTRLLPDQHIVYTNKQELKRAKRIVLWPYISIAAAASVAIFFMIRGPIGTVEPSDSTGSLTARTNDTSSALTDKKPDTGPSLPNQTNTAASGSAGAAHKQLPTENRKHPRNTSRPHFTPEQLNELTLRKVRLENGNPELAVVEGQKLYQPVPETQQPAAETASTGGLETMNNPIKPITNRLENAINKDVDFRTAKAGKKGPGGFYLKVGNFELSHREH